VFRLADEKIGCSLAEAAESDVYTSYLAEAAARPGPNLHVIYINTSLRTKVRARSSTLAPHSPHSRSSTLAPPLWPHLSGPPPPPAASPADAHTPRRLPGKHTRIRTTATRAVSAGNATPRRVAPLLTRCGRGVWVGGGYSQAYADQLVPTITCTSSNVVATVLQAAAQVPDVHIWYGPDTYMGGNLADLFRRLVKLGDEEIAKVHPEHNVQSVQSLLSRLHYFQDGTCIVHHLFGGEVIPK
jgi:hypothetical protein